MRADLHALDDDALATLANRGLVKRALREVADGKGPTITDEDGRVTASFADGTTVVLAPGATLDQARCTCAASGVCRHRLMLVVAYRELGGEAAPPLDWSPAEFTDAELEEHLGARTYDVARRTFRTGYRARVRRASAADPVTAVELAACTVRFLVAGVVTESAVRSANRVVRIAESRVARTTVAPSGGRWDDLPAELLIDDLDAEAARLASLPPTIVRARVVAESVRAIRVEVIEDLHFRPETQQLVATILAPRGTAQLIATHNGAVPGAIDALARALSGDAGAVRFVAGHLRRHRGGLDLEPTAVAAGATVIVPAFADASGESIATTAGSATDRLAAEVTGALELTAELVHRGRRHLAPGWPQRAERVADSLRQAGLCAAGAAVAELA